jgi:hypothetical protein
VNTVAFADLDAGVWGAAWGPVGIVATRDGEPAQATLSADGSTLTGDGIELTLTPEGEASNSEDGSTQQLCRVRGAVAGRELDCLGRSGSGPDPAIAELQSVRELSAWFDSEDGVYLRSLRPRKAKGHDGDVVSATLFAEGRPQLVEDPRISTTYDANGLPARVNLELWLSEDEEEQYPRRLAAETLGTAVTRELGGGSTLQATPMSWHFRGRDGAGVYLVVRPA